MPKYWLSNLHAVQNNTNAYSSTHAALTILQYLLFQQTTSKHFKPTAIMKNF